MGPSGSGKSTLLNILGFLLDSSGGEYLFEGKRYQDNTEDEIARIRNREMGFVFQTFNLLPRLSVFENIQLPLMYSGRPESEWKARVEDVVDIVGARCGDRDRGSGRHGCRNGCCQCLPRLQPDAADRRRRAAAPGRNAAASGGDRSGTLLSPVTKWAHRVTHTERIPDF